MNKGKKKKPRLDISAWVLLGAVGVVIVMLTMMIFMQYQQRKNQAVTLFVEKGTTLIQSFEAGLRCRADIEGIFHMQKLLMETADQPDIDYMIVTDRQGNIVADSDPVMVGTSYGLDLALKNEDDIRQVQWRQSANPEGADTFEVYRLITTQRGRAESDAPTLVVFIGFNMDKIEKASREDAFRTVFFAVILVVIGSFAIVSLFLVQAYRHTRASLSRITLFSEALVKNLPIALLAVDKTGRITACNQEAGELLSCDAQTAVGRDASRVLPASFNELLEKIERQETPVEADISVPSVTNGAATWEVVGAAFADDGVSEGRILLARNVTALRQMEREVARSRHLHAIGSLAAGVAHEIRNPLSSIKGFAVYFKQRLAGNREDEETADIMIAETERLNRVISQLIEFARPMTLAKEPSDLADLVTQTLRLTQAEAKAKDIEVSLNAQEHLPKAMIDPDKVKQVLINIFLNAFSSMGAGGKLAVSLSRQNDFLEIVVTDTGSGISDEDLPRIYDPYFTSKPAGTGLGLAVAQKIMEAHGGSIKIESRAGEGTSVTLGFPLSTKEA
jgi:two-component system sensor histidine kinase HydH